MCGTTARHALNTPVRLMSIMSSHYSSVSSHVEWDGLRMPVEVLHLLDGSLQITRLPGGEGNGGDLFGDVTHHDVGALGSEP